VQDVPRKKVIRPIWQKRDGRSGQSTDWFKRLTFTFLRNSTKLG
jgi:hypothetical protein